MIQVTNEIHQVGGSGLTGSEEAIYLIRFGEEAALVDAGCGKAKERLFRNHFFAYRCSIPEPLFFHSYLDYFSRKHLDLSF